MGIGMKRVTALNGTCCNFMHKPDDIDVRFGWSLSSGSQELLLRRNVRFYSMEYTAGEQLGRRRTALSRRHEQGKYCREDA